MKTLETESWIPNPEKEGFLKYQGQNLVSDVFNELKTQVEEKFRTDENIGFDYISLDYELKDKAALFPKGCVFVFVLPGSSEAYRVNLCVFNAEGSYRQIASCKVWSHDGAHEICKFIYKCFYGKRGNGI